jgi:hypothetical protein
MEQVTALLKIGKHWKEKYFHFFSLVVKCFIDSDPINMVLATNMFLQFYKEILNQDKVDLQQHTAAPAPGLEVVSESSPQCPLAHESLEL